MKKNFLLFVMFLFATLTYGAGIASDIVIGDFDGTSPVMRVQNGCSETLETVSNTLGGTNVSANVGKYTHVTPNTDEKKGVYLHLDTPVDPIFHNVFSYSYLIPTGGSGKITMAFCVQNPGTWGWNGLTDLKNDALVPYIWTSPVLSGDGTWHTENVALPFAADVTSVIIGYNLSETATSTCYFDNFAFKGSDPNNPITLYYEPFTNTVSAGENLTDNDYTGVVAGCPTLMGGVQPYYTQLGTDNGDFIRLKGGYIAGQNNNRALRIERGSILNLDIPFSANFKDFVLSFKYGWTWDTDGGGTTNGGTFSVEYYDGSTWLPLDAAVAGPSIDQDPFVLYGKALGSITNGTTINVRINTDNLGTCLFIDDLTLTGMYDTSTGPSTQVDKALYQEDVVGIRYYNLQGIEISQPQRGSICIVKTTYKSGKSDVVKRISK